MKDFRIKIIEEETPERAEYEVNDFIKHCKEQGLEVLDITSHVNTDGDGYFCYTFIIQYCKK